MHKQRIIDGIEKVFEGYRSDPFLKNILTDSFSESISGRVRLFPSYKGITYFIDGKGRDTPGRIFGEGPRQKIHKGNFSYFCEPEHGGAKGAAELCFEYFCLECDSPLTLTKAKAMLAEDLGVRVNKLKSGYREVVLSK